MDSLIYNFKRLGARAKIRRDRVSADQVRIDIGRDRDGEFFDLQFGARIELDTVDVRRDYKHLLLLSRDRRNERASSKFLCGHDERHWFVAAVPEVSGVRDVLTAMDALKPAEVWQAIERAGVKRRDVNRRRTDAFVRQGEWFFIPAPGLNVRKLTVLKHEPITRGRGKAHWCEYLARSGGELVYVSPMAPSGLSLTEYQALDPKQRDRFRWRTMQRDATVYVRGYVRHPDHATIRLRDWHRVVMNTESRARAMTHLAFLD